MPDRTRPASPASPSCPICRRALPAPVPGTGPAAAAGTHPFCSARCKMVDLGNWLGDGYVIAGASLEGEVALETGALRDDGGAGDVDAQTLAALLRELS